jgi:Formyl transferase
MSLAVVPTYPKRLVYLGTPALAAEPLRALVHAGFDVALVVTRVDKRRGRGSDLAPSPVKAAAIELGLPVSHNVDDVLMVGADLGVVVAFGQLIKPHILEAFPMVNLHFSLLPRWRGAAPMERALLAGSIPGRSLPRFAPPSAPTTPATHCGIVSLPLAARCWCVVCAPVLARRHLRSVSRPMPPSCR